MEILNAGTNNSGPITGNTIGGPDQTYRNWIEDNTGDGVLISGVDAQDNVVTSNVIKFNTLAGVEITDGASHNSVGGNARPSGSVVQAPGNDISSNAEQGVFIHSGATANRGSGQPDRWQRQDGQRLLRGRDP